MPVHQWFRRLLSPWQGLPAGVYALTAASAVVAVGCFVYPLQTLILSQHVHLSPSATGLAVTLSALVRLPGSMLGGRLVDRWGGRVVYCGAAGASLGLYILCGAMAPTIAMVGVLTVSMFFLGAAGPALQSMVADLTTPPQRASAFSLEYMGWNVGFAVGPAMGGLLFERHLPWVFWGDAATSLLGIVIVILFVRLPPRAEIRIQASASEVPGAPPGSPAEAAVEGSTWSVLRSRPVLPIISFLAFLLAFTYTQWGFLLPMQLIAEFGSGGAAFYGLLAGFNGLVVIAMTPVLTRWVRGQTALRGLAWGGLIYALSLGPLAVATGKGMYVLLIGVFTLGEILVTVNYTAFITCHSPISHRGRLLAITGSIAESGAILGPIVMGVVAGVLSVRFAWIPVGLCALFAAGAMWALETRMKRWEYQP